MSFKLFFFKHADFVPSSLCFHSILFTVPWCHSFPCVRYMCLCVVNALRSWSGEGVVFLTVLVTAPTWPSVDVKQKCVKSMETLRCQFIESLTVFKHQRKVEHAVLGISYSKSCESHIAHLGWIMVFSVNTQLFVCFFLNKDLLTKMFLFLSSKGRNHQDMGGWVASHILGISN